MRVRGWILAAGLLLGAWTAAGCAGDPYEARSAELTEGAPSCGRLEASPRCPSGAEQAAQCMADAWTACTAATLETTRSTIEGDPITELLVIQPTGDGCRVIRLRDTRADRYGPREVDESVCRQLEMGDPACVDPVVDDCLPR